MSLLPNTSVNFKIDFNCFQMVFFLEIPYRELFSSNEVISGIKFLFHFGCSVGSAPPYYGSSLGSNPDISQKYKMGDISKGVANAL